MYQVAQHGEVVLSLLYRVLLPVGDDGISVCEVHRGAVCRQFSAGLALPGYLGGRGGCFQKRLFTHGLGEGVSCPVSGKYADAGTEVDVGAHGIYFSIPEGQLVGHSMLAEYVGIVPAFGKGGSENPARSVGSDAE